MWSSLLWPGIKLSAFHDCLMPRERPFEVAVSRHAQITGDCGSWGEGLVATRPHEAALGMGGCAQSPRAMAVLGLEGSCLGCEGRRERALTVHRRGTRAVSRTTGPGIKTTSGHTPAWGESGPRSVPPAFVLFLVGESPPVLGSCHITSEHHRGADRLEDARGTCEELGAPLHWALSRLFRCSQRTRELAAASAE